MSGGLPYFLNEGKLQQTLWKAIRSQQAPLRPIVVHPLVIAPLPLLLLVPSFSFSTMSLCITFLLFLSILTLRITLTLVQTTWIRRVGLRDGPMCAACCATRTGLGTV